MRPGKDIKFFHTTVHTIRNFLDKKGFIEIKAPNPTFLSVIQPAKASFYTSSDKLTPLPQSFNLILDNALKLQPKYTGYFLSYNSFWNNNIYPIIEFNSKGDIFDSIKTIGVILKLFNVKPGDTRLESYKDLCSLYNTQFLTKDHNSAICREFARISGIVNYPASESIYWNTVIHNNEYCKDFRLIVRGVTAIVSREIYPTFSDCKQPFETYYNNMCEKFGENNIKNDFQSYTTKFLREEYIYPDECVYPTVRHCTTIDVSKLANILL